MFRDADGNIDSQFSSKVWDKLNITPAWRVSQYDIERVLGATEEIVLENMPKIRYALKKTGTDGHYLRGGKGFSNPSTYVDDLGLICIGDSVEEISSHRRSGAEEVAEVAEYSDGRRESWPGRQVYPWAMEQHVKLIGEQNKEYKEMVTELLSAVREIKEAFANHDHVADPFYAAPIEVLEKSVHALEEAGFVVNMKEGD